MGLPVHLRHWRVGAVARGAAGDGRVAHAAARRARLRRPQHRPAAACPCSRRATSRRAADRVGTGGAGWCSTTRRARPSAACASAGPGAPVALDAARLSDAGNDPAPTRPPAAPTTCSPTASARVQRSARRRRASTATAVVPRRRRPASTPRSAHDPRRRRRRAADFEPGRPRPRRHRRVPDRLPQDATPPSSSSTTSATTCSRAVHGTGRRPSTSAASPRCRSTRRAHRRPAARGSSARVVGLSFLLLMAVFRSVARAAQGRDHEPAVHRRRLRRHRRRLPVGLGRGLIGVDAHRSDRARSCP